MGEVPSAENTRQSRKARLVFFIVWLFLFVCLGFYVRRTGVLTFDLDIRNAVHAHASLVAVRTMLAVSLLASRQLLVPAVIVILIILAALKDKSGLIFLGCAMIGEVILEVSTKDLFHRARPESFFNVPLPHSYSYPSGHALGSICFYGAMALVGSRYFITNKRWLAYFVATLIVCWIGLSRIYLGVHYPTDVIGGYLLGAAWLSLLSAMLDLQPISAKKERL